MNKIWKATRVYEGRVTDTERSFDVNTAKARIRNVVHLSEPAEWEEIERHGSTVHVLTNTGEDVEVEVKSVFVHGDPEVLFEDE